MECHCEVFYTDESREITNIKLKYILAKHIRDIFAKTGCSGWKSNGTVLSSGHFSGKKEDLQRYSSFLVFTEMIEISLNHLLLDETRSRLPMFSTRALTAFAARRTRKGLGTGHSDAIVGSVKNRHEEKLINNSTI